MKNDWLGGFLPLWMWGTMAWLAIGFTLMPEAFRRPLFIDHKELWATQFYDPTDVDPEIALKLGLILGMPVAIILAAVLIAGLQEHRKRRRDRQATR